MARRKTAAAALAGLVLLSSLGLGACGSPATVPAAPALASYSSSRVTSLITSYLATHPTVEMSDDASGETTSWIRSGDQLATVFGSGDNTLTLLGTADGAVTKMWGTQRGLESATGLRNSGAGCRPQLSTASAAHWANRAMTVRQWASLWPTLPACVSAWGEFLVPDVRADWKNAVAQLHRGPVVHLHGRRALLLSGPGIVFYVSLESPYRLIGETYTGNLLHSAATELTISWPPLASIRPPRR